MPTTVTAAPSPVQTTGSSPGPTVADARRAAAALEAAGARRVLLFGSVARGDQTPDSDVDIAAIFDDVDYDTRDDVRIQLDRQASRAAGRNVHVLLTDFPEFNARAANVPTGVEACIVAYGQVMVDLPPTPAVRWNKEMTVAMTADEEALERFMDLCGNLRTVTGMLRVQQPIPAKVTPRDDLYLHLLAIDRRKQLGQLHLAIEAALKTLLALHGTRPPHSHKTSELEDELPEPHRSSVVAMRGDLPHEQIERWHVEANYNRPNVARDVARLDQMVRDAAAVSIEMTEYTAASVAERPGGQSASDMAQQMCDELRDVLGTITFDNAEQPPAPTSALGSIDTTQFAPGSGAASEMLSDHDKRRERAIELKRLGVKRQRIADEVDRSKEWVTKHTKGVPSRRRRRR